MSLHMDTYQQVSGMRVFPCIFDGVKSETIQAHTSNGTPIRLSDVTLKAPSNGEASIHAGFPMVGSLRRGDLFSRQRIGGDSYLIYDNGHHLTSYLFKNGTPLPELIDIAKCTTLTKAEIDFYLDLRM